MLRKFKITIDGKEYLVETEEIDAAGQSITTAPVAAAVPPVTTEAASAAASVETPTTPAPAPAATGDTTNALLAPMPGTVIKLLVKPGDTVTENQPLLVLEAMKMENEVVAAHAGTVGQFC